MKKSRLWILLLAILAIILWGAQWALNGTKDTMDNAVDTVWDLDDEAREIGDWEEEIDEVVEWDVDADEEDDATWDTAEEWVEVGGAMMIPSRDIVDNAVEADNVTTLVAAVKAAWLVDTLKSEGPFTVFAPINDAFDALPAGTVEDLLKQENKPTLTSILTYHVVPGSYTATDLSDGMTLTSVQGEDLTITYENDTWKVNGVDIIIADIISSNGVTHAIGTVLMPADPAPAAQADNAWDDADTQTVIDLDNSSVVWKGRAGPKSHEGTIDIKSADLVFEDGKVVDGTIIMDMPSIQPTDTDSQWLIDHLNAEDYFDTATYPIAKLDITTTTDDTITGDLSIKDKTFPVTFKYTMWDGLIESDFSIDSTRWGVAADGVAGALISDNVDLKINLAY